MKLIKINRFFFFMALTWTSLPFIYNNINLIAQEQPRQFAAGPYMSLKTGFNGGNYQLGRQNGISFNGVPDFGFTMYMPMSETAPIGFSMDLGYSTYAFSIKSVALGNKYSNKFSYLALAPYFHISYFQIGFCFGVPLSGNAINDIDAKSMNPLAEFRLRGEYNLMSDPEATFNIYINAGYMLTGIFKDYAISDPYNMAIPITTDVTTNRFNPRIISISIGVNYLFNILSNEVMY